MGPEWAQMVKLALQKRARMRIGPRRTLSEYVRTAAWDVVEPLPANNRMVWRLVLDGGGVPDRLRPMVLAYVGCLHGTGCVERGLGRDKRAVVEPHVGSFEALGTNRGGELQVSRATQGRPKARARAVRPVS